MKNSTIHIALMAAVAALFVAGCEQKTESPESGTAGGSGGSSPGLGEAISEAAKPIVDEASKAVESVQPAVEKAAGDVKEAASSVVSDTKSQADALIAQASKLVQEARYSDAGKVIEQLASMKLTPEQEKLVEDLKTQIQKALSSLSTTNAAQAVGNLLK